MALTLFQHHQHGRLDDRDAVLAALEDAGWPAGPALGLVTSIEMAAFTAGLAAAPDDVLVAELRRRRVAHKAPWKAWTEEDRQVVVDLVAASGGKLPSEAGARDAARLLGRSPKAVKSQAERIIAGRRRAALARAH